MYFYVKPSDDAVSKAFKKCGELMANKVPPEMAVVVPQLSNLEGLIAEVLGEDAVKTLSKNKVINLDPESIRLFTKRNPPRFFKGPLLVAFTPKEQLQIVILNNPEADIVFVPWSAPEMDFYVQEYEPSLI